MNDGLLARFEAKVDKTGDCWLWTAAVGKHGYGVIGLGGRKDGTATAHRLAYEHWVGPIPDGEVIRHLCHVRRCVRPDHLATGTQYDNVQDTVAIGRARGGSSRGSTNPSALLTEDDVRAIRVDARPRADVATAYGVSLSTIHAIHSGQNWAHVA